MSALAFIGIWVVVGLALFFISFRGGPRKAREALYGQSRRSNRFAFLLILVVYVGFGVALPTLVLAGNEDDDEVASEGITLTASEEEGRKLFGEYCNQCHQLAASKTVGQTGPDLNELRPNYAVVVNAVTNGIQRGNGTMPAGLVEGDQTKDVACYIERTTRPGQPPSKQCVEEGKEDEQGGAEDSPDGRPEGDEGPE